MGWGGAQGLCQGLWGVLQVQGWCSKDLPLLLETVAAVAWHLVWMTLLNRWLAGTCNNAVWHLSSHCFDFQCANTAVNMFGFGWNYPSNFYACAATGV